MQIGSGQAEAATSGALRSKAIQGIRRDKLHGLVWDAGVIYGPWLEGVGSRNQTTRFKGYHAARRTSTALQKQAPRLAQRHIARAMRRMNG